MYGTRKYVFFNLISGNVMKISYVLQIHLNIEKFFVILSVAKNM